MKKKYEKPMVMFENFAVSMNVAGDCTLITTTQSEGKYGCGYETGNWTFDDNGAPVYVGGIVFVSAENGCTILDVDGEYNGVCYHGPYDEKALFNS